MSKPTILKLLADLGTACAQFHNEHVRDLTAQRIQCDEIWQFVGAKQKNVVTAEQAAKGWGDTWTWTAIDADTKLICTWFVGSRDALSAEWFMGDLWDRMAVKTQLTTDGHHVYRLAVEKTFGTAVDYAQLVKLYGSPREGAVRYSPARLLHTTKEAIRGNPDPKHISTSFVERQNLTMRMSMRRFTRLTNGFSKKVENHAHAVAVHFVYYNFARIHRTLRMTPAMAAGYADHVWSVEELIGLLDRRSEVAP